MTERTAPIVLLGPQRLAPTVRDALESVGNTEGPIAVITAGWEEREAEDLELGEHLGREAWNLGLHRRAEEVFGRDPDLFDALQRLHDRLFELQDLYRVQLRHRAAAAEDLLRRKAEPDMIDPERETAMMALVTLDDHHVERVQECCSLFSQHWRAGERHAVAEHRNEIHERVRSASALCIAGGHVGILFNRMWLFDVLSAVRPDTPIVAWSAGAMVLADRIVLFHDRPPQGRGYAEVLRSGFGLCPGIVPLPHASTRLNLGDPARVQLLSRRFPDAICAALDDRTRMTWDGHEWTAVTTKRLTLEGKLMAIAGGAS